MPTNIQASMVRHHYKDLKRAIRKHIKSKDVTVVLFDNFGVVSIDPLNEWKKYHKLNASQISEVRAACRLIDSGKLELWPFYAKLGVITGQTDKEVKGQLDSLSGYNKELLEIIKQLRQLSHVRVGLLSNAHRSLHQSLWKDGIHSLFDDVLTSQEVSKVKPKPDPEFFIHAINRLGGQLDKTLFFDDLLINVEGAAELGIDAHLFVSAAQCKVDLHSHKVFG